MCSPPITVLSYSTCGFPLKCVCGACTIAQGSVLWYLPYRSNLIENMHRQYIRTGYIWEQYDDQQGSGKVFYFVFDDVELSVV